jgi:antirestriction protein
MKTQTETTPRLYVGTYAKYNNGSLGGAWIDLEDYSDRDAFLEACAELHSDESDPELMFQDFEGFPRCWYSESSAPADILWEWMELDENEREAFGLYADHIGGDASIEDFRDAYNGTADSEGAFAGNIAEECDSIPKDMPSWIVIDWDASWSCNLRFDYFCERGESGELHFFRNN